MIHVDEHPSKFIVLESSHYYPDSRRPFPHTVIGLTMHIDPFII